MADGLVVPVLTGADKRDWADLAKEAKRLAAEARRGKIIGAGKGTFTVSNLGMFGVDDFTAIINPPESAILAVGAIQDEVVAIDGNIGIRPMMKATLSVASCGVGSVWTATAPKRRVAPGAKCRTSRSRPTNGDITRCVAGVQKTGRPKSR